MKDEDPYEPSDLGDEYDPYTQDTDEPAPAPTGSSDGVTQGQGPDLTPATTPAPRGPVDGGTPSYVSLACTTCGYNLTGVSIGGNCPECGVSVQSSLEANMTQQTNAFAVTSLVLGIVSFTGFCCCPVAALGILGLIFGGIGLHQCNNADRFSKGSRSMAIAGLICSGVSLLLGSGFILLSML